MNSKIIVTVFISIILFSSILFSSYYSQFTRATNEDIDKLIDLIGELYSSKDYNGKKPTEIRMIPYYDLEGNIVSYTVLYYFGDGKLPSNEELFSLWKTKIDDNLDDNTWASLLKKKSIHKNISTLGMYCFYEFQPATGGGIVFPMCIQLLAQSCNALSEHLDKEIEYNDFKGFVYLMKNGNFCKFMVDGEEYFINT